MAKIALLIVRLVKEADERRDEDLEREILRELAGLLGKSPWCEKIEKCMVLEGEVVAENRRNWLWEAFSRMSEKACKQELLASGVIARAVPTLQVKPTKELTDFQVRWHYEKIAICLLGMVRHFEALIEGAPDPELRKAAGGAWDAISRMIVGLRERFGLAWVDSEEYRIPEEEFLIDEGSQDEEPNC